ncbi:MFS transporter [Rhodovastum atsumiense]|uniref:MHS family MFS transporter n=1 Tax=Rhodovastum atsumiense TaxID=504468 RepID=A0A5M6ISU2_9PROT|nr:MFS transporter [Rhodovastum atsumiense]KAA5611386.1 MHS family MFS transporter [Rhodovastum atsumiense]
MSGGTSRSGLNKRIVVASTLGTVVEYYDFTLYATSSALVFNKIFFPSFDPFVGLLASFSTFFVGYCARPLGGILFGHFGDRTGRKTMLMLTMLIMGLGTFAIGLIPDYNTIGIAAPILLVVLRALQGIGIGGEYGGGVLMTIEHSAERSRGLAGSLVHIGVPAGFLLPIFLLGLLSGLSEEAFLSWGWRVPFLLSLLLVAVGLYIRSSVEESPDFEAQRQAQMEKKKTALPISEVLRHHWREVLLAIGAKIAESGLFNIYAVFLISYAVTRLGMARQQALDVVLIACLVECFTLPFFGWLSDRIGRPLVYVSGAIFQAMLAVVFFQIADWNGVLGLGLAAAAGIGLGHGSMYGAQAAFFAGLFPTRIRYSGLSLIQQVGPILGGGLSPLIGAALLARGGGDPTQVTVYMIGIATFSAACAIALAVLSTQRARAVDPATVSG